MNSVRISLSSTVFTESSSFILSSTSSLVVFKASFESNEPKSMSAYALNHFNYHAACVPATRAHTKRKTGETLKSLQLHIGLKFTGAYHDAPLIAFIIHNRLEPANVCAHASTHSILYFSQLHRIIYLLHAKLPNAQCSHVSYVSEDRAITQSSGEDKTLQYMYFYFESALLCVHFNCWCLFSIIFY